jgi:hypothetical protein
VITSAGLNMPLEAFLLGKPVGVVPIPGQWEQFVNAFHLEQAGMAAALMAWDYSRVLDVPPPASNHPLLGWLSTPIDALLDYIISGTPLPTLHRPRAPQRGPSTDVRPRQAAQLRPAV